MWALVPVKGFADGKQRLAGVLTPDERRTFCRAMLEDVLQAVRAHPLICRVILLSNDGEVEELARSHGIDYWTETSLNASGLNPVVNAAARRLGAQGVQDFMVVHGDLPLLSTEALTGLISQHRKGQRPRITIAPDRHGEGSNIVVSSPPGAIEFQFGPQSYQRHCRIAEARGVVVETFFCQDTSCDFDNPEDLPDLLRQDARDKRSACYLYESGIAERLARMDPGVHRAAVQKAGR